MFRPNADFLILGCLSLLAPWPGNGLQAQAPDTVRFTPDVAHPTFAIRDPVMPARAMGR